MIKMFPKSSIITPLELTFKYIVLNYCLRDTYDFSNKNDNFINFIRVTSLKDRRLTAQDITAQQNQSSEKMCQHPLWREDSGKIAYIAELLSRNYCWGSSNNIKRLQLAKKHKSGWSRGIKLFGLTNICSKYFSQTGGSVLIDEIVKELRPRHDINRKALKTLCYGCVCVCGGNWHLENRGIAPGEELILQNGYHSIQQHHVIPSETRLVA